jgi:hypothetical protein
VTELSSYFNIGELYYNVWTRPKFGQNLAITGSLQEGPHAFLQSGLERTEMTET